LICDVSPHNDRALAKMFRWVGVNGIAIPS